MAITPKTYPKILKKGLQASYNALTTKEDDVLYFCTDTGKIYKGSVDFTKSVHVASTKPTTPIVGVLYIIGSTGTVESYDGTNWHVVSYPLVTTISSSSTDSAVPSAKAVYDFVEEEIASIIVGGTVVNKVEASTTEGNISVTTSNVASDVVVHGVVTTPTYNATSRTFTFPISDGDDVVVELGKDIFIDPDGQSGYHADTKEIWLYLNDGSATKDPTIVKIPAAGLVDVYTGGSTAGVVVSVDSNTKVITATPVLKPNSTTAGSEFTNALKLDSTSGLYVDLSEYALAEDVEERIAGVEDKADDAQADADTANAAIAVLNGDAQTTGSVAKAVNDAKVELNTAIDAVDAKADAAQAAATAAQDTADQNEADILALSQATTLWGTF